MRFSRSANGILERTRAGQRKLNLVADHRPPERGIGLFPSRQGVVRDAGRADLSAVEQVSHAGHDHRIGDHRVGLMDLVERDAVEPQPPRTGALALLDHGGEGRDREDLAGHRDLGALVAERLAEDPLAFAQPVYLGGVEQRHPQCPGAPHDVTCGTGGIAVSIAPLARSELPGAQADSTDASDSLDIKIFHVPHPTEAADNSRGAQS
jgi:hypothetical protein